jgi:hypothetical protein
MGETGTLIAPVKPDVCMALILGASGDGEGPASK